MEDEAKGFQHELRQLLRRARFEAWPIDMIEDSIDSLFRRGVTPTTPPDTGTTSLAPSP